MAKEYRSWGYDRIVGARANLGLTVSDQTVGNVLKRHGMAPAPEHKTTTTWEEWGFLAPGQSLIRDWDGKYCPAFQQLIDEAGVKRVPLPPRSPNLNAYAERWVRSIKDEALSSMILFGERSLRHVLHEYVDHYHHERNHQGKDNVLLFPTISQDTVRAGPLQCRERLGGLLKYYECEAA